VLGPMLEKVYPGEPNRRRRINMLVAFLNKWADLWVLVDENLDRLSHTGTHPTIGVYKFDSNLL